MKPFFKTSEFWISFFFLLSTVASVVASAVPPATGLKVGAFAVGCYALSRGLAKLCGLPDVPPLMGLSDLQSKGAQGVINGLFGVSRPAQPSDENDDESGPDETPAKE
jgi:hypothetical protein